MTRNGETTAEHGNNGMSADTKNFETIRIRVYPWSSVFIRD